MLRALLLCLLSLFLSKSYSQNNGHLTYRVQFLSKTYIDSTYFKPFKDSFYCNIETYHSDKAYYRYQIIPKQENISSAKDLLKFVRRTYRDAFIVKYVLDKRIN